ncbi:hypothetical protein CICLE_v10029800mg [Citrus x clementina]|uniref:Uncharacterized protein n=1 Tax=Citrus clementina TaxID=85681 RepID=V4SIK7_CITCL|nr:hypothetical protein CICLE_v10029800mg [Citrus x clementina]
MTPSSSSFSQAHTNYARKLKKEIKKRVPFKIEANANGLRPWPDLPQQLISVISRQFSTLMLDISYGGVTKSWRAQTKQSNSEAMIQQPRLELHDVNEDTKFKFNTAFHLGEWAWIVCNAKKMPMPAPWKYYVGYSDGILVSRGASPNEYYLNFPEAWESYLLLPSWDQRILFRRAVITSSRIVQYWKMNCIVIERNRFTWFTNGIAHQGKFYALSLHGTLAFIVYIRSQPSIAALGPKRLFLLCIQGVLKNVCLNQIERFYRFSHF